MNKGMTVIVKTVARLLFPFMFLFGIYVTLHGHLTPGGGFPGGVIIATSIAMLILGYGTEEAKERVGDISAEVSESVGALMIVGLGIVGVVLVGNFLQQVLPPGHLGKLFSGGNLPVLNIGVGIKVGAGMVTILYAMLGSKGEKK